MRKRSVIASLLISIPLTGSSIYIALKLGALPWPTIFCAIIAYALLQGQDLREVNIAEAGGTTGALIGGAIAFTVPAIWFMGGTLTTMDVLRFSVVILIASLTGIFLSSSLQDKLLDTLPFPEGQATAEMLKSISVKKSFFLSLALAGIFSLLRDFYLPGGYPVSFLGISLVFSPLLMGIGGGYIMGKKTSFSWFAGALLGWVVLEPLLGLEGSMIQNIGLGLLLGSSISFLVSFVLKTRFSRISIALAVISFVTLTAIGLNPLASLIAVLFAYMFAAVAFRMTGETNVDPLEQFGLVTGVVIFTLFSYMNMSITTTELITAVLFVASLAAVCGDIGHDFKAAKILGTDKKEIMKIEIISTVAASIFAPIFLLVLYKAYTPQLFTDVLPAPQAQMVARSIFGYEHPWAFLLSFALAFSAQVLVKDKILSLPALGIGMFLNLNLGLLFFAGGFWRAIDERRGKADINIPSSLLAGEGLAGFASALLIVLGIKPLYTVLILAVLFLVLPVKHLIPQKH
ncbi:MAG: OPT/YSL family transporter [Candidatus Thermoplasmatota archaeon]|nr:OPT/YSL family transporter [Candidatus Thermoplasmatota archaeon]